MWIRIGALFLRASAAESCERFFGAGVNRMRRDGRDDQRIVFPVIEEFLGVGEGCFERFIVGGGEINDRFAENAAHAGFFRYAGYVVFEIVHVRVVGDSAA